MAGRELRADIVIGGRADNSFSQLGRAVSDLGRQVDQISRRIIDFGKDSVDAYVNYEDAMLDAQVALSTQYTSASQLGKVMEQLDSAALNWAQNSRFTTKDVGGAISEASHAGWELQKILNGIPSAMKVSLAGGMELSEGLEYLIDITNAAGLSFEDFSTFTDTWAYAANRSSTTIPEMGQAMQKMGATMQFVKGDMAGLTTMLAVLADNGTKGTAAGTLLRNSMIRVIAPTQKAAEAMDELNLTGEELEEIYADSEGLEEAVAMLTEMGFSAYDSNGVLKPFLKTWEELDAATKGMTEEERNNILSAIFPTRTITAALALLDAASNGWDGLYEAIQGNSAGYGESAMKTMESGLGGTLRSLEASWDVLKTKVGGTLKDDVGGFAAGLERIVNAAIGMDDSAFAAIVSGLEVIAGAGPGLLIAGGAIRAIGAIIGTGPGGWIAMGALAIGALASALKKLDEINYEDQFGSLSADEGALSAYIQTITTDFSSAYTEVDKYNTAFEQAMADYTAATTTFKESLITTLATGGTLTEADIKEMEALGTTIYDSVMTGISKGYSEKEALLETLAGMGGDEIENDDVWGGYLEILNAGYEDAKSQAEKLGRGMRQAMSDAFADGELTSEELSNLQSYLNQYNEILAEAQSRQDYITMQRELRRAQTMGLAGIQSATDAILTNRDAQWDLRADEYAGLRYDLMRNGATDERLSQFDSMVAQREREYKAESNMTLFQMWDSFIRDSELGGVFTGLNAFADNVAMTGAASPEALASYLTYNSQDRGYLEQTLGSMIDALGGASSVSDFASYFAGIGDNTSANAFERLLMLYELSGMQSDALSGVVTSLPSNYGAAAYSVADARSQYEGITDEAVKGTVGLFWDQAARAIETGNTADLFNLFDANAGTAAMTTLQSIIGRLGESYNLSAAAPFIPGASDQMNSIVGAYRLMYDNTINPNDYLVEGSGIEVPVGGDVTQLGEDIAALDGTLITANVNGNTSALESAIESLNGKTITVRTSVTVPGSSGSSGGLKMKPYAEGGRATEPSIFGEVPGQAEWAIPEEHSARTAELLNMARAASGFTWGELLSRNNGTNSGAGKAYTLVYSPTINARDTTGVQEELILDKKRLEKWFRDMRMRDEVEVYS